MLFKHAAGVRASERRNDNIYNDRNWIVTVSLLDHLCKSAPQMTV